MERAGESGRFLGRERRKVTVPAQESGSPADGGVQPYRLVQAPEPGFDLVAWGGQHRDEIERTLVEAGGVLLRGFAVPDEAALQRFVEAQSGEALNYTERSSPRSRLRGNVFTSTDHPRDEEIFLHNEQSYNLTFPRKIAFCCLQPARSGGATPVADSRRIYQRLDPSIRERFLDSGYLYVRNFGRGVGLSWQEAFQTEEREVVEAYCTSNQIETEWLGGDVLRTRQRRRVAARHPVSGEPTWFNHLTFFHVSTLPEALREGLTASFAEDELPNNTLYGNGRPIEPETLDRLRSLYAEEKRRFEWQRGDVLLLDNMLTAHGRDPFEGPRKIVVAMAEPRRWEEVDLAAAT